MKRLKANNSAEASLPMPHLLKASLKNSGFKAAVRTDGVLEMMVYGEIVNHDTVMLYEYYGIPTDTLVSAIGIKQQIDKAGSSYSKICLRINSPGGSAFEGIAIGNILKATGKTIDVFIDAMAASAASIVAMSGTTITMANNAMMMIHNAWTDCTGYASDMRKMADTLDTISSSIGQTYADKTGKTLDEIRALMDAETWMGAADCVKNGFATGITAEASKPAMAMARTFAVMNRLKLPASFLNAAKCACDCSNCGAANCQNCSDAKCDDLNCANCPMQASTTTNRGTASVHNDPEVTNVCECPCQNCAEDNCDECTNRDCDDANCSNCPMQAEAANRSNLSLIQARQWEIEHGIHA